MNKILALGLLAVLIPTTHIAHLFLNNIYKNNPVKTQTTFNLPSPDITKVATLGYDHFVADILWLELIQYLGESFTLRYNPEVYSLVDNITTLDPEFEDAYIYGSYALVDNKEYDKAMTILDKGMKNLPDKWYIPYQAGFIYYINKKNKPAAISYFKKAGKIPGSPEVIPRLIAQIYSKTGKDIDIQITLWNQVYDKAKKENDKYNMDKAYQKLVDLKIQKDLETIREAIDKYNEKYEKQKSENVVTDNSSSTQPQLTADITTPKPLKDIKTLVTEGYLSQLPLDPFDRPYIFNEKTQEVTAFPTPWDNGEKK